MNLKLEYRTRSWNFILKEESENNFYVEVCSNFLLSIDI